MNSTSSQAPFDILLATTGSVAAFKAVALLRLLVGAGLRVQTIQTKSAQRFVGPETFSALSGRPCWVEMFTNTGSERHVELAASGARYVIAPATADILARLAQGRADDLVTATALCWPNPISIAPAMHPRMWANAATQRNVNQLVADGHQLLGPVEGAVANGDTGLGRMLEPDAIFRQLVGAKAWHTRRVIVTAGPTFEPIDPVRFIGNRSSGKMGFQIARAAALRGAQVDLIAGPVHLETPAGVTRHNVRTALEMQKALDRCTSTPADALVMAAAVGDFRPQTLLDQKLKRVADFELALTPNPDLLAEVTQSFGRERPVIVGFALETGDDSAVIARAMEKLKRKGVDLIVANAAIEAFEHDTNRVHLVSSDGVQSLPTLSKAEVADSLLDWIGTRWKN
jgi:phosphopantothenoylcysteine decarboxylase / phosphopantothenate---cysteine ligase